MTDLPPRSTSATGELFVQTGVLQTRLARVADGGIVDIYIYPSTELKNGISPLPLLGGVFVGRVVRAVPGVDAVFVDILPDVTGFLAARYVDKPVHEGARILVQVIGEARGDKGPQLTAKGLGAQWKALQVSPRDAKPRTRVDAPLSPEAQIVRDHVVGKQEPVWFGGSVGLKRAQDYARLHAPGVLPLLHAGKGGATFDAQELDAEIDAALSPRAPLPCGGWITFESTEGFTAVDVNSGGFAASTPAETALEVNKQAAVEIAAQVRLRAIGGLIVIDFIQMKPRKHRAQLETAFKTALNADPTPCRITPLSPFGVIEMARRRSRPSLESQLTEPAAAPRRDLANAELADRLARALEREAAAAPGLPLEIQLSAALGQWLSAHPLVVQALESRVAGQVKIQPCDHWPRARFDVHVKR